MTDTKLVLNLGELTAACQLIEQEFGAKWLRRKASATKARHPIPAAWRDAVAIRDELRSTRRLKTGIPHSVAFLIDVARDFGIARTLSNYDFAIKPRLKQLDFNHTRYETQIAATAVRNGYTVSFVSPSQVNGVQTPDLLIQRGPKSLYAECKRKDPHKRGTLKDTQWPALQQRILATLEEMQANYEVIVVALGPFEEGDDAQLIQGVRAAVSAGWEGPLTRKGANHTMFLRKLVLPEPSANPGVRVAPGKDRRGTRYQRIASEGNLFHVRGDRAAWLYSIDGHQINTLVNSFNAARTQLSLDVPGVVYIDVDVTNVEDRDLKFYFDSAGLILGHLFAENANTRVAAIVLTAVTLMIPVVGDSGQSSFAPHIAYAVVRNQFHPLSARLPIPPETPVDDPM